jgi:hypothetical protein
MKNKFFLMFLVVLRKYEFDNELKKLLKGIFFPKK